MKLSDVLFAELAGWFESSRRGLERLRRPGEDAEAVRTREALVGGLKWKVGSGTRSSSAGEVAEQVRRLREEYGHLLEAGTGDGPCQG